MPKASVIITTYNRKKILRKCLYAICNQTVPKTCYEVIIIDDGSTDGTEEYIQDIVGNKILNIRYLKQSNKGPGAARNYGIKSAKGEIIMSIGDDIIVTPYFIEEHLTSQKQYLNDNIAIVGYTTWSPEIKITSLMRWLENGGPQSSFHKIQQKENLPFKYFYTGNISINKEFLLKNGLFDEDFRYAAFEDSELGFRLTQKGLRMIFNKNAVGFHYHPATLKSLCKRAVLIKEAQTMFSKKTGIKTWDGDAELLHKNYKLLPIIVTSKALILFNMYNFLEKILDLFVFLTGKSWLYIVPIAIVREKYNAKNGLRKLLR